MLSPSFQQGVIHSFIDLVGRVGNLHSSFFIFRKVGPAGAVVVFKCYSLG